MLSWSNISHFKQTECMEVSRHFDINNSLTSLCKKRIVFSLECVKHICDMVSSSCRNFSRCFSYPATKLCRGAYYSILLRAIDKHLGKLGKVERANTHRTLIHSKLHVLKITLAIRMRSFTIQDLKGFSLTCSLCVEHI